VTHIFRITGTEIQTRIHETLMKAFHHNWLAGIILAALLTPRPSQAQSTYIFQNYLAGGFDVPVFDAAGNRLSGTGYVAVLYGGPSPDTMQLGDDQGLAPMSPVPFTFIPVGLGGYFRDPSFVEVNSIPPGGFAWLQVRAWDVRLGATFDDAVKQGLGGYGESSLFYARGGNPTGLPGLPEPLTGLQSFSLLPVVPEPNSFLLVLPGLPLLLFLRRRRCK
jgi:hypothetical protein